MVKEERESDKVNRFIVPSTEEMTRLNRQQRLALMKKLQDALIELGSNHVVSQMSIKQAIEKRKELARVEMSKTGQHVSVEMIEARELLEQMPVEDDRVTAARRYELSMAVR